MNRHVAPASVAGTVDTSARKYKWDYERYQYDNRRAPLGAHPNGVGRRQ